MRLVKDVKCGFKRKKSILVCAKNAIIKSKVDICQLNFRSRPYCKRNVTFVDFWIMCFEISAFFYLFNFKPVESCNDKGSFTNHVATMGEGGFLNNNNTTRTVHNSYLLKVATWGGRGSKFWKNGYIRFCAWPLSVVFQINFKHLFLKIERIILWATILI